MPPMTEKILLLSGEAISSSPVSPICNGARVDSLNTSVGFVTQDSNLFPWLTTLGNVEFPLAIRGIARAERREKALHWLTLWDPSQYIGGARMPMLYCNGTNDKHFRPGSWQKTYRTQPGPHLLSLKLRMPHGHPPAGDPKEITVFADSLLT